MKKAIYPPSKPSRRARSASQGSFIPPFASRSPPATVASKGELGGGPLYDIGVYCINAARYLFRAEPEEVFAVCASGNDTRFSVVEEMSAAVLRFPNERLATFTCSFGAADRSSYEVIGTRGVLRMDPAYEMVGNLKCEITVDGRVQKTRYPKRDQFGPELVYFSNCILEDSEPEPGGREGLADVRIIHALLESQKENRTVNLSRVEVGERPSQDQGRARKSGRTHEIAKWVMLHSQDGRGVDKRRAWQRRTPSQERFGGASLAISSTSSQPCFHLMARIPSLMRRRASPGPRTSRMRYCLPLNSW